MPSSAQDGSGSVGGVEAQEGSPLVDAAPQAFRRARGEWSPVGECAQAGASSLFEMPWGRVAGAGAGVGSGASAASSGASESDSGTVAGDSGDAGASPFLRHVSMSLREPGGGGGHMSLAAGEVGAAFAAPDACAASNSDAPSRAARAWSATSVATSVDLCTNQPVSRVPPNPFSARRGRADRIEWGETPTATPSSRYHEDGVDTGIKPFIGKGRHEGRRVVREAS